MGPWLVFGHYLTVSRWYSEFSASEAAINSTAVWVRFPGLQVDPVYLKFVLNATDFPLEDSFDYIIVGVGTAGCPLAATLSQSFPVLLRERGEAECST